MPPSSYIDDIFKRFETENPEPKGELYYTNTYTLLLAVVLSAQATDKGVNKATRPLFDKISTPQALLNLGLASLQEAIQSIGLYKTKAKHIMALSQLLIDRHHGQVPNTFQELINLPGVGRKTAQVVLNTAFHHPTVAVDTHVFRLAHRLGLSQSSTPEKVEKDLMAVIPPRYLRHAHHWLILHGRYICKARAPQCTSCFLKDICPFYLT